MRPLLPRLSPLLLGSYAATFATLVSAHPGNHGAEVMATLRQGGVGEALVELQLERGKQHQVHGGDQRNAGEQATQADQPGSMAKEQQQ